MLLIMEEQPISFETAKLAKEKKFTLPTIYYYFEDGEIRQHSIKDAYGFDGDEYEIELEEFYENWNNEFLTRKNGDRCFGCSKSIGYLETFSAPYQSLLQKWLRDKYKLFVSVDCYTYNEPEIFSATLSGYDRKGTFIPILIDGFTIYDSYEEALEEGLQEALKLV